MRMLQDDTCEHALKTIMSHRWKAVFLLVIIDMWTDLIQK